jgi:hypothetical protein
MPAPEQAGQGTIDQEKFSEIFSAIQQNNKHINKHRMIESIREKELRRVSVD